MEVGDIMKFVMSYSCGKDSTLALHRMIKNGNEPIGLLVTVDKEMQRSFFHGVPEYLLNNISKSLAIPLILVSCKGEEYVEMFDKKLKEAKELGAEACAFGDIDIEDHRKWCTDRCNKAGLKAIFPLWQENREDLTYEFIDSGFKAVIKNIQLRFLGENFLGKVLTRDIVKNIKETGADPCGENGEYHTFVYDGPIFNNKIDFITKGNILTDTHGYLDVR